MTIGYFILSIPADSLQRRKVTILCSEESEFSWTYFHFQVENLRIHNWYTFMTKKIQIAHLYDKSATPVKSSQLLYQPQKWGARWLTRA